MNNKVLVCITIQENSRRLISEGFNIAQSLNGSLHILHIRKGETVFDNVDSSNLLADLFAYGSELGGEIHFLCSENISDTISNFIIEQKITEVVIGEAPEGGTTPEQQNVYQDLTKKLGNINLTVLPREEPQKLEA